MARKTRAHFSPRVGVVAFLLFCLCAGLYFLVQLLLSFGGGVETVTVQKVTVHDAVSSSGCFIRQEQVVVNPSAGAVSYTVSSGERVQVGTVLARKYQNEAEIAQSRKRRQLEAELAQIDTALRTWGESVDTGKTDRMLWVQMQEISKQAEQGELYDLAEQVSMLRQLLARRFSAGKEKETLLQEKTNLTKLLQSIPNAKGGTGAIVAPVGGYFAHPVDGLEQIYTIEAMQALTPDTFEAFFAQEGTPSPQAIGKMEQGFEWFFVLPLKQAQADTFVEGKHYQLHFEQMGTDVPVLLQEIRKAKEGTQELLIFRGTVWNHELVAMRKQQVDIIKGTYTGLQVPKSAIRTQGDTMGVYILGGTVSRFKKVVPLYEGDTYYIIAQGSGQDAGVVAGDRVIVNAKGIADQKVVKT